MIKPFLISISQLPQPVFRKVMLRAVLLSVFVFASLAGVVSYILSETSFFSFWLFEMIVDVLGGFAIIILTWIFFPIVASFFITFFLEDIVEAVENRYFPDDSLAQPAKLSTSIAVSLRFTSITFLLNLLALPLYLLTIWFPPATVLIFYSLNGYLLGREYFELVALRHLDSKDIALTRKAYKWQLFFAGVMITFLFTIPIVNLFAPIISVAAITHIFNSFPRVNEPTPI